MTLYNTLLLIHIVAAMIWVGGGIMLVVVGARIHRAADPGMRLMFVRQSAVAGPMSGISALVLLGAGIGMVIENEAWTFSQLWIWLALVLLSVSLAVGASYYGRVGKRMEEALEAGEPGRAEADRLIRQYLRVATADLVLLLVIVWDMVFKPGL